MSSISSSSEKCNLHHPKKPYIIETGKPPRKKVSPLESGGILGYLEDLSRRYASNLQSLNDSIVTNITLPNLQWLIDDMSSDMTAILEKAIIIRISIERSNGRIGNELIEMAMKRLEDVCSLLEKMQSQQGDVLRNLAVFAPSVITEDFRKEHDLEIEERSMAIDRIQERRSQLNREIERILIMLDDIEEKQTSEIPNVTDAVSTILVSNVKRMTENKLVLYSFTGVAVAAVGWYIVSGLELS